MPIHITEPDRALLACAREARLRAYAPYSGFRVGAAVLAGGKTYQGVNAENAAFGSTVCAEQAAALAAITAGHTHFDAIAIVGDSESPCVPCGACRQFLAEFGPDMRVIMGGCADNVMVMRLDELLPDAFAAGYLRQEGGTRE